MGIINVTSSLRFLDNDRGRNESSGLRFLDDGCGRNESSGLRFLDDGCGRNESSGLRFLDDGCGRNECKFRNFQNLHSLRPSHRPRIEDQKLQKKRWKR
ncbi:hypothetical protein RclHR1_10730001 [Rhizophagus clarus]|uniref:Uncharacterized protein n=1 Tax=Rhizophagus clarus TaxID=94130 RepID=A0A2Z6QTR4_9GLOM|nr:hypothetical protein RclHR1_10730001 [Rhizophagus clarus]